MFQHLTNDEQERIIIISELEAPV